MTDLLATYKKLPVEIQAVQWTGDNGDYLLESELIDGFHTFTSLDGADWSYDPYVDTLEGRMTVSLNDYIIVGVQGERYPCKPEIFKQTYIKVR